MEYITILHIVNNCWASLKIMQQLIFLFHGLVLEI